MLKYISTGGNILNNNNPRQKMATSTKNIIIIICGLIIVTVLVISALLFINRGDTAAADDNIVVSLFLSMNPIIRIDIDLGGTVLGVHPYNDAARPIVEGFAAGGSQVNDTINALVNRAVALGVVPEGVAVTVSVNAPDDASFAVADNVLSNLDTAPASPDDATFTISRIQPHQAPTPNLSDRPMPTQTPAAEPGATPRP
jgi:hypothetical protein